MGSRRRGSLVMYCNVCVSDLLTTLYDVSCMMLFGEEAGLGGGGLGRKGA